MKNLVNQVKLQIFKKSLHKYPFRGFTSRAHDEGDFTLPDPVIAPRVKPVTKTPIDNTVGYEHNYEKIDGEKLKKEEKEKLNALLRDFLKKTGVTKEEIEKTKRMIRDPLYMTETPDLFKLHSNTNQIAEILQDVKGLFEYHYAFKKIGKFIAYTNLLKIEESDPSQIVRKIDRVMLNSEIPVEVDKNANFSPNFNSPDFMKRQERYEVKYNYNFEEHKDFTKTFQKQKELDQKRIAEEEKYLKFLKANKENRFIKEKRIDRLTVPIEKIPDFKIDITNYSPPKSKKTRRIYDRRLHDINIAGYDSWRCFDRELEGLQPGVGQFVNVLLSPKYVVKAFGLPEPLNNGYETGKYYFEDNNLDMFMLADWKQTTLWHGFNFHDDFYKTNLQQHIHPNKRISRHPSVAEFWTSEEPKSFRIYYSIYAEARKFRMWIRKKVEEYKDPLKPSKLDELEKKFGKMDLYTDYNIDRPLFSGEPPVYKYNADWFMGEGKSKIKHEALEKPKYISPKEGEFFLHEEWIMEEAQKGYIRETKEGEEKKVYKKL